MARPALIYEFIIASILPHQLSTSTMSASASSRGLTTRCRLPISRVTRCPILRCAFYTVLTKMPVTMVCFQRCLHEDACDDVQLWYRFMVLGVPSREWRGGDTCPNAPLLFTGEVAVPPDRPEWLSGLSGLEYGCLRKSVCVRPRGVMAAPREVRGACLPHVRLDLKGVSGQWPSQPDQGQSTRSAACVRWLGPR